MVFNDEPLTEAIAVAFSSEAVNETFQKEILKLSSDHIEKRALAIQNYHLRADLEEPKQYGCRNALRVFDPT